MVMIIGHHLAVHGYFYFPPERVTLNREFVRLIEMGGKLGVDIFVLITGYFMTRGTGFRVSKALKFWGQVMFYSLTLYLFTGMTGICPFGDTPIYKVLLPLIYVQWWFATTYFVLFLLSPYINRGLATLTRGQYKQLLGLMTVLWCLIPTIARKGGEGNDLTWFVYLYCLAGYFRLYGQEIRLSAKRCIVLGFGFIALNFAWALGCDILGTFLEGANQLAPMYYGMNHLPILLSAVFLFLGFSRLEMGYHPLINKLGSACFGIYLLHDSNYAREYLWLELLPNNQYTEALWFIPAAIAEIALIFFLCAAIDLLRIATVEKWYMKLVTKLENRLMEMQIE